MKVILIILLALLGGCTSLRPYCSSRLVPINDQQAPTAAASEPPQR